MKMHRLALDYVEVGLLQPSSEGLRGNSFETQLESAIQQNGSYNPLTANIREGSSRWKSGVYYISLGNHRYWLGVKAKLTHMWVLSMTWDTRVVRKDPNGKKLIHVVPVVIPLKEPPWDIRDFEVTDVKIDAVTSGRAWEEEGPGVKCIHTGRMLMEPDQEVEVGQPIRLVLRNETKKILGTSLI